MKKLKIIFFVVVMMLFSVNSVMAATSVDLQDFNYNNSLKSLQKLYLHSFT